MIKEVSPNLAFRNRRVVIGYKEDPIFVKQECVKTVRTEIVDDFHMLLAMEVKPKQSKFWYPCHVLKDGTIYPTVYMNRNIPTSLNKAVLTYDCFDETQWKLEFDSEGISATPERHIEQGQWEAMMLVVRKRRAIKAHMRYWKEALKIPIMERGAFAITESAILLKYGLEND